VYPLFEPVDSTLSIKQAEVDVGGTVEEQVPPKLTKFGEYPAVGNDVSNDVCAEFNVRIEAAAEDSFAAAFERSRFGIAIAAMIKMIATTISNSINEKPFCLHISVRPQLSNILMFALEPPLRIDYQRFAVASVKLHVINELRRRRWFPKLERASGRLLSSPVFVACD